MNGSWMARACVAALFSCAMACGDDDSPETEHAPNEHERHDGQDGEDGADGEDGSDGEDGAPGPRGEDGRDGADGEDGSSCTVTEHDGATMIACPDGTTSVIDPEPHAPEERPHGRLFFSDDTAEGVRVLDLGTGEIIATFAAVAPNASLYASESARVVSVVQGAAHRVDFLDTGLASGDGAELPRVLEHALIGETLGALTPIHVDSHHGYIAVHFDGRYDAATPSNTVDARNYVIEEHALFEDALAIAAQFRTEPQHGVSLVTDQGLIIVSAPTTDRALSPSPNGFTVHELSGELVQTIHDPEDFLASCWGMHGEAEVGGDILFGCHERLDGGIMVLSWDDAMARYTTHKVQYVGYPNAMRRTSTLRGHPNSDYAVGQWGYTASTSMYTGLVRIDPTAAAIVEEDVIELGAVYCDFDFEREHGERVIALARDGTLHSIDVDSWSGHKTAELLPPSDTACAGRMLVGAGVLYITVTERGEILEVDATSLEVRRAFQVGGRPRNVALAAPGQAHAH